MVLGYIPQTIQTIRTRKTDDIALGSFVLMALGAACFFVQGVVTGNVPLAIANGLTATMSTVIFVIKMIFGFSILGNPIDCITYRIIIYFTMRK